MGLICILKWEQSTIYYGQVIRVWIQKEEGSVKNQNAESLSWFMSTKGYKGEKSENLRLFKLTYIFLHMCVRMTAYVCMHEHM